MNWFVTKSRLWESAVLLIVCFTLFRPDWWLNQMSPPYEELPASAFLETVGAAPDGSRINFVVEGIDLMGDDVRKTVNIPLGEPGDPIERLRAIGLTLAPLGETLAITGVAFGSYAGASASMSAMTSLPCSGRPTSPRPSFRSAWRSPLRRAIAGLQFMRGRAGRRTRRRHAARRSGRAVEQLVSMTKCQDLRHRHSRA